tara:strand:- start:84 stop:530 length:447 start_codon:yes stop_codon:yes gene_type:complete
MSNKPLFLLNFIVFFLYSLNSSAEFLKKELLISNSDNELKYFTVEVADNDKLRSLGFMGRTDIPEGTGMLFIWNDEAYRNFWMKNTPSSLDIIFFDKNGYFINVQENTIPYSLDNIPSLKPSKYVLELIAGSSKKFNLYNHSRIINFN